MRIPCPFCGERDHSEFTYLGDADGARPDPSEPGALQAFVEFTYLRTNPDGEHAELWFHGVACRRWIRVVRHTGTHCVLSASFARAPAP